MEGINEDFTDNGYSINNIITDLGSEYKNQKFYDLFNDVNIFHKMTKLLIVLLP